MNQPNEEFAPVWAAGFMSGTSIDAVDAALILTDGTKVLEFGPVAERKYTPQERAVLKRATDAARAWNWSGARPENEFDLARSVITQTHHDAWRALLSGWKGDVPALAGVHGQTVLHRAARPGETGATLQLLDEASLQACLQVRLAFDFRTADVEAGGQGAPLAPAFHAALLHNLNLSGSAAVLNLGGVANITFRTADGDLFAFDTGPANGPIDEWVERHGAGTHDIDGRLAAKGNVDETRLQHWMDNPWFDVKPPKSLDRFDFSAKLADGMSLEDGTATLTAFSAEGVARAFSAFDSVPQKLIVCGGGRRNPELLRQLQKRVSCEVATAEDVGWLGDSIEAQAFALLAVRTLRGLPISWPGTTNVPQPLTGGRLYP